MPSPIEVSLEVIEPQQQFELQVNSTNQIYNGNTCTILLTVPIIIYYNTFLL